MAGKRAGKKAGAPRAPRPPRPNVTVVTSSKTLITYKEGGSSRTVEVEPVIGSGNKKLVRVVAPCGDDVEFSREVALAVANAVIDAAGTL